MNTDRIEEIQKETAYPQSVSVKQALLQVWNETVQSAGCLTVRTEDELRVLAELLCHSKGAPGFDKRIARLREEVVNKWEKR